MKAILCGSFGSKVVEFTDEELERAHQQFYPEHYQGKLPLTDNTTDPPPPPADYWPPARGPRSPTLVRIPRDTPMELCAEPTCRKRIWKVKHPKTGKLTPAAVEETITLADGEVVPTGAFAPYLDASPSRATLPIDGLGYSHFIDCPASKHFRRSTK